MLRQRLQEGRGLCGHDGQLSMGSANEAFGNSVLDHHDEGIKIAGDVE
jgi:hypothetical protein